MPTEACIFNHNTSPFAELALRSLLATEREVPLNVTVSDNQSIDEGVDDLKEAAAGLGAAFVQSRWPAAEAKVNSHGDAMRDFVLANPEAELFLMVDADIVFTHPGTVARMSRELSARPNAWAVQAAFHWAEEHRGPGASLNIGYGAERVLPIGASDGPRQLEFHGKRRCHPGCTLIRNSDGLRRVAETIGFSCAHVLSADPEVGGFHDTMGLASYAMATQGSEYFLSEARVVHYFNVSYDDDRELTKAKLADCRRRLASLRDDPARPIDPGPWG